MEQDNRYDSLKGWLMIQARQFHQQGYPTVDAEDLWDYFRDFLWRKQTPTLYYHQVCAVLALTPNQYFDFVSLAVQRQTDTSLDDMSFEDLF